MEIKQQYLQNYLHDIAIDQLMDDYRAKGYQVVREEKVGDYRADLVAKKSDSFPLSFGIILKHNETQELFIADAEMIEVDTSSFYD
ncbi:hypothetical protein WBJ53_12795 [Spirosoma sp. SC4-14]|uniref:hypothetical protein n=1 Tax=Spirosoma sp. SC4-14 TaxID=3128900 RepID=UPI0030CAD927